MMQGFLRQAAAGQPVFLPDVRAAFQRQGTLPFHIHVTLYDGSVRVFPLTLPRTRGEAEADFAAEYLYAHIYNILSALGAVKVELYWDPAGGTELAGSLDRVFQTRLEKGARTGYGKCLNVNERVLNALFQGREGFRFCLLDVKEEPAVPEAARPAPLRPVFDQLPARTRGKLLLGMDVGGTDVKLAVSADGDLVLCKEFDWFPAAFARGEELTGPLLLLTRLMRAAGSLCQAGRGAEVVHSALERRATLTEMERAAETMERAAGGDLRSFNAIGLSFPDVVIQNRIVGGETPKTQGMRNNPLLDYEEQFAKITGLNADLAAYTVPGGPVRCVNDGPMAAFTAAVEQAAGGADLSQGFFAHSLGTDLGTGWVLPDGSIPDLPLEVYNFILDLGSRDQRDRFDPEDVRSNRSVNTGLPGALQKYASQWGVFRLAAHRLPREDPALFQEAVDRGLFRWEGDRLIVPTEPEDMRKPCLEFFMEQAARSQGAAELFREIGEYLAVTAQELNWILRPEARERTLFGRLVMRPACFGLIREGAARRDPSLRLSAAGRDLANTRLMGQLDRRPGCTAAQFAQAVGAIYYSVS